MRFERGSHGSVDVEENFVDGGMREDKRRMSKVELREPQGQSFRPTTYRRSTRCVSGSLSSGKYRKERAQLGRRATQDTGLDPSSSVKVDGSPVRDDAAQTKVALSTGRNASEGPGKTIFTRSPNVYRFHGASLSLIQC